MTSDRGSSGRSSAPPRWVFRSLWALHRAGFAISGGRLGLRSGTPDRLGMLRLRTSGRRSGEERAVMLSYLPAEGAFVVVASNAGATYAPAWWLNLEARPEAIVEVPGRTVPVRARAAATAERAGLWQRLVARNAGYERYAESAAREIPIVILEPIAEEPHA